MRRFVVTATVTAALLVGAVALPATGAPSAPGTAKAGECTWQRHSKRVVKRVRRHGKVRRVVRWKRWWTCVPQAAPVETPPAPAPPPTPVPEPEPEPEVNRVSARAAEFYFTLSRPKVKAGAVTVELNNQGEDAHNLNLRREGDEGEVLEISETGSGQRSVAGFDLPAGRYRLWCSLPEHEEKGMSTALTVE